MAKRDKERLEVMKNIRFRIVDDGDVLLDRDSFDFLVQQAERVQDLERSVEGYRSNWYKCVEGKNETDKSQGLKITPKGSVNTPWG